MAEHSPDTERPLSAILRELCADTDRTISIADLVASFGPRAFGAILLIFALACALPLPPGSSTILGAPLVLLAPQVALGSKVPWLPRSLRDRDISTSSLRKVLVKLLSWLERMEAVSRPRLTWLFGIVGDRLIGLVCTLLALVLILPIPGGNVLPAASVSVLSLALVQRDGILAILGYALAAASAGVLVLAFGVVVRMLEHALSFVTTAT